MNELTGLKQVTSEQHADISKSRIEQDFKDICMMVLWLKLHNPFDIGDTTLHSISSGLTASPGGDINCDKAEEVGLAIQMSMDGLEFSQASLKRKDQVKTLAALKNGVKIGNDTQKSFTNN